MGLIGKIDAFTVTTTNIAGNFLVILHLRNPTKRMGFHIGPFNHHWDAEADEPLYSG